MPGRRFSKSDGTDDAVVCEGLPEEVKTCLKNARYVSSVCMCVWESDCGLVAFGHLCWRRATCITHGMCSMSEACIYADY
jgi:hypothetical protein